MEAMEAMEDTEALEDMVGMAMEVMEAMALEAMEVMGTARGQQILAMATVAVVVTEDMGVTAGVMVVIEVMATMAEANQIQMMMTRILREYQ